MSDLLHDMYLTGARRLRQWARVGIGRLTGSTTDQSGKYKAALALEEGRLIMRAELSALSALLIAKGITTREELCGLFIDEMNAKETELAKEWPEVQVMADGTGYSIKDVPALALRIKREGWPP